MTVLFVLQNAWRKGAEPGARDWDGPGWQRALWRSQTGKRLREMIPDGTDFEVVNASPFVGGAAWAAFAADCLLMRSRMKRIQPALVVLCGKVAQGLAPVVADSRTPHILAPHPAWRRLSKAETARIRKHIEKTLRVLGMVNKVNGLVREGYEFEAAARLAGDMHGLEVVETYALP